MGELKPLPCPFCSGLATVEHFETFGGLRWIASCQACSSRSDDRSTEEAAFALWNRRPSPSCVFGSRLAEAMAAAPRWVPVSERLPGNHDNVRVRIADLKNAGQTFPAWAYYLNGHPSTRGWHIVGTDSFGPAVPVVLWLDSPVPPLPAPPSGEPGPKETE